MGTKFARFVGFVLVVSLSLGVIAYGAFEDRASFKILVVAKKGDGFLSDIQFAAQDIHTVRGKVDILSYEYSGNFNAGAFSVWMLAHGADAEGALLSLDNKDAKEAIRALADKKLPELAFWIFPYVNDLDTIGTQIPSQVYFLDTNVENFLSLLSGQIQKPLSCRTTRFRFSIPSSEQTLETRMVDALHLDRVNDGNRGCGTRYYRETAISPTALARKASRVKGKYDCVIAYGDRNELRSCVMAEMQVGKASRSTRFVYASAPPYDGEAPSLPDDFLKTGNHWAAAIIRLQGSEVKDLESRFREVSKRQGSFGRREFLALEAASMADSLIEQKRKGRSLQLKTFASVLGEVRRTSRSPFPFRPFFLTSLGPLQDHGNRGQVDTFEPDLGLIAASEH